MDCGPPGSSVHGIFQARVLEWSAIAFSVNSPQLSLTREVPRAGVPGFQNSSFYCAKLLQLFLTPSDSMDHSLPDSTDHGILQAQIQEQVAISSSRGSSRPRNQTHVSCISYIGRRILYRCTTWEALISTLRENNLKGNNKCSIK